METIKVVNPVNDVPDTFRQTETIEGDLNYLAADIATLGVLPDQVSFILDTPMTEWFVKEYFELLHEGDYTERLAGVIRFSINVFNFSKCSESVSREDMRSYVKVLVIQDQSTEDLDLRMKIQIELSRLVSVEAFLRALCTRIQPRMSEEDLYLDDTDFLDDDPFTYCHYKRADNSSLLVIESFDMDDGTVLLRELLRLNDIGFSVN